MTSWEKDEVKAAKAPGGPRPIDPAGRRTGWVLLLIFLAFAAGIVAAGRFAYLNYERHYRAEVERQLSAVADLKVGELAQWREDRMGDSAIFFKNPSFSALVRSFFDSPVDADAQRQLQDWLGKYPTLDDYDQVRLMDTQGVVRLSLPADPEPACAETLRAFAEALQTGRITVQDFHRHSDDQRIYLMVMIPILDESDANRPLGVLVLRIDPAKYLYPFIQHWPTPSQSAETLLVRRDGNEALFLNELRFQTNSALNLREPMDGVACPEAQAALGREGVIMDGIDYRGVPVLAALRTIPGSPWSMVARMDAAEVYAPLRARLWLVVAMVAVLLLGGGAGVGLVWRQQRVRFYRQEVASVQARQESEANYRMLFHEMQNGFAVHEIICDEAGNPSDYRFLAVNPAFERITGLKAAETVGRTILEILPDIERSWIERYGKVALTGEPVSFEDYAASMKKHFEVVAFRPKLKQFACIFYDITERKRTEAKLQESARMIEGIINAIPVRVFWKDKNLAYLGCNAAFARDAGFAAPQDIIGKDDFQMGWRAQAENYRSDDRAIIESGCAKLLIEESQTTPTGESITLQTSKLPLRDANGEITGVLGTYMDITARKQAEADLREKAESLRASNVELEQFNRTVVGREVRMIELKAEINGLLKAAGQPDKYKIIEKDA
jgi:PAS domain S-box-containing protein